MSDKTKEKKEELESLQLDRDLAQTKYELMYYRIKLIELNEKFVRHAEKSDKGKSEPNKSN